MGFAKPTWGVRKELASHLQNGVGRYICQLQRVTIKFCKIRGDSRGVRDFLEYELVDFSRKNPGIVVYVKPRRNRPAVLVGEYLSGCEQRIPVSGLYQRVVGQWLEVLRTRDGTDFHHFTPQSTATPTVQGYWTPWTNKPTWVNALDAPADYPHPVRSRPYRREPSASERLMDMQHGAPATDTDTPDNVIVMTEDDVEHEDADVPHSSTHTTVPYPDATGGQR